MSQPQFTSISSSTRGAHAASTDPMLATCRDLALKMLSQSLEGFFARLEDTYFELADNTNFSNKVNTDVIHNHPKVRVLFLK